MHTALLVDELSALGHAVTLLAKEGSTATATVHPVLEKDFTFTAHPAGKLRDAQAARLDAALGLAIRTVRDGSFDVVVNNTLSPVPYVENPGTPMLSVFHTPRLPRVAAVLESERWNPSPSHRFVSVSAANARGWRGWVPDIEVIHNGIRLAEWNMAGHQLRTPGTAVWAGRITPEKGLHVAIEAARLAGMKIGFAGPISDTEYYRNVVEPLLGDGVQYAGHLDHAGLAEFMGSGEVFIASPVWAEPFGLTIVEAMACGTPVAALPAGAIPEIVDERGGVVSASFAPEDLAQAITRARLLSSEAVRASADRFASPVMARKYVDVLRELATLNNAGTLVH